MCSLGSCQVTKCWSWSCRWCGSIAPFCSCI
jgi:hypothetical protein